MFNRLVGNERVKTTLRRMLINNRVPGALLFAGDEGIGKSEFALELAKAAVCRNVQNGEACDQCSACLRAAKLNTPKQDDKHRDDFKRIVWSEHPDVGAVLPYNRNIFVDAIRDVVNEANYTPYEANKRFFLIDEADKLNNTNDAAANALLKILEEPPATSHIILITARPNFLLQTIRSRCQIIRFAPLGAKEIADQLVKTKKVSPNDADLAAKLARGSLGKALAFDLEAYKTGREIMFGVLESLIITKDRARLLKIAEEMNGEKVKSEYEARLEILQTLIHDVWTLHLGGSEENLINTDLRAKLIKLADKTTSRELQRWLGEIERLRENLTVNLNRKIATDALFMRMVNA